MTKAADEQTRSTNRRNGRLKRHPEWAGLPDSVLRAEKMDGLIVDPPDPGFTGAPWQSHDARDWYQHAACATYPDHDAWFPEKYDTDAADYAIKVCYGCPVMFQCEQYAREAGEQHGIWGGLTPRERGVSEEVWATHEMTPQEAKRLYWNQYRAKKKQQKEQAA